MKRALTLLTAFVLFSLSPMQVSAQNWNVEQVSSLYNLWSSCRDVVVQGDFAYLATYSSGFCVVDISNPANPVVRGSADISDYVDRISIHDTLACLKSMAFYTLLNISTPDSLIELCSIPVPGVIQDVVLTDQYLYITSYSNGLLIFDVSQPAAPVQVGNLPIPEHTRRCTVVGNYAYVSTIGNGIAVVDITDPTAPVMVSYIPTDYEFNDFEYDNGILYGSCDSGDIVIMNVADPASPFIVSQFSYSIYPIWGIAKSGSYLFVAAGWYGARIYNVSDPTQPAFVRTFSSQEHVWEVCAGNNYLYIADDTSFLIYQITNPVTPQWMGSVSSDGYLHSVVKRGDLLYIGDSQNGLRIVDVTDPALPMEIGRCFNSQTKYVYNLAVTDSYAYLACSNNGFTIVDITDPTTPTVVSHHAIPGSVCDVAVVGNYAYLANFNHDLRILDVSDPFHPVQISTCAVLDMATCIDVQGNFAYVGDWGFEIINVANPANPFLSSHSTFYGGTCDVKVQGNLVYMVGYDVLLEIYGISNHHHPRVLYELEGGNSQRVNGIDLEGDYAFLATDFPGMQVLNVSNPTRPRVTGYHQLANDGMAVAVDGVYAYLVDQYHLEIFDCSEAMTPFTDLNSGTIQTEISHGIENLAISPNPFNPTTTLSFTLPQAAKVSLEVFDINGRNVGAHGMRPAGLGTTPPPSVYEAGTHTITFDGSDLPSGIYFARLTAGEYSAVQKLILLK